MLPSIKPGRFKKGAKAITIHTLKGAEGLRKYFFKLSSLTLRSGYYAVKIKFKDTLLDLLFPKFCFGCSKEGDWVCKECFQDIVEVKTQVCPACGRVSSLGKYCSRCAKEKAIKGILASCYFEEGPIKELIHNFKYNHILEVADIFVLLMQKCLKENLEVSSEIQIVPVPLYWLRQAQRGYNQSAVLAKKLSEGLGVSFSNLLCKKKHTRRQVVLKSEERIKNLTGVFGLRKKINLRGAKIILIDDVTTTGATLNECARVLKKAGAKEVWGLVVARG